MTRNSELLRTVEKESQIGQPHPNYQPHDQVVESPNGNPDLLRSLQFHRRVNERVEAHTLKPMSADALAKDVYARS